MRTPLPNRRPCEASTVYDASGRRMDVCVGFDADGRVREIFADGAKIGSEAEADIDDGLVVTSLYLQSGAKITDIARHIGREAITPEAPAASRLGLAIMTAAAMEGTP